MYVVISQLINGRIRRLPLFTKTVICSMRIIVILQFGTGQPKSSSVCRLRRPCVQQNLSSGFGGMPRSWVRSLLLASSIFSCTKRERVRAGKKPGS